MLNCTLWGIICLLQCSKTYLYLRCFSYICSHTCLPWVLPSAVLEHNHMHKDWWENRSGILVHGGRKVCPQILLITLKLSDTNESRHFMVCMNRRNSENDTQPSVQMRGDIFAKRAGWVPLEAIWEHQKPELAGENPDALLCGHKFTPAGMLHVAFNNPYELWLEVMDAALMRAVPVQCLKCSYRNTSSVLGQQGGGFESPRGPGAFLCGVCVFFLCLCEVFFLFFFWLPPTARDTHLRERQN